MTNYEKILKDMTIEQMAEQLVTSKMYDNGDYSFDGEDEYWVENYEEIFNTPNGYCSDSFEEAVEETIKWLKKEYVKEKEEER